METKMYVSYLRCSTSDQKLGIESQRDIVNRYVVNNKGNMLAEYHEWESGKKDKRIELDNAINHCKATGSILIVAKLDRLSRNVSFLFKLKDSGIDIVVPELPQLNTLTFGIFATIAQSERETIAQRTKDALKVLKDKGIKLGRPDMLEAHRDKAVANSVASRQKVAADNEANIRATKYITDRRLIKIQWLVILKELQDYGFKTSTGLDFKYVSQLQRLVK